MSVLVSQSPLACLRFPRLVERVRTTRLGRLKRRHVLMLALAAEILGVGFANADRYRPPGIPVPDTIVRENAIV